MNARNTVTFPVFPASVMKKKKPSKFMINKKSVVHLNENTFETENGTHQNKEFFPIE